MKINITTITLNIVALLTMSFVFLHCKETPIKGKRIIFTMVSELKESAANKADNLNAIFSRAKIASINKVDREALPEILTTDFYSACNPQISFDGKRMLFAGQQVESDSWQIWEMNLHNLECRKITSGQGDSGYPAYLPNDKIVYTTWMSDDSIKAKATLFTCNLDGNGKTRITFQPHFDFQSTVMHDGRILFASEQVYPTQGDIKLLAIRPDGTKAELFYKSEIGKRIVSRSWETPSRNLVFVESNGDNEDNKDIVTVSFNNPYRSRKVINSGLTGEIHSLFPIDSGEFLLAYQPSEEETFGLYQWNPEDQSLGSPIFAQADLHVLEPVLLQSHVIPKALPTIVDNIKPQGWLLCMNVNIPALFEHDELDFEAKAVQVQISGIDEFFGVVDVEEDGSFYVEVPSNKPFRFNTIDAEGQILREPSSWIWVRPNERRSCIGCHENREMAPENTVPYALKNGPVQMKFNAPEQQIHFIKQPNTD